MSDSGTAEKPPSWWRSAFDSAREDATLLFGYFAAIIALATPLSPFIPDRWRWASFAIGGVILALALIRHGLASYLRWRRARVAVVRLQPGWFRLSPWTDSESDRRRFDRRDREHEKVRAWLESAHHPILYLTGSSGSGKSSLLAAHVLPTLRESTPGALALKVRSFDDPYDALRRELLRPDAIWKSPPTDTDDPRTLIERAAAQLNKQAKGRRLLLVFEQFEEFLIIFGRDRDRLARMTDLLGSLQKQPIPGVSALLVVRSDCEDILYAFQRESGLPMKHQDENHRVVPGFTEQDARDFLADGLAVAPPILDAVFGHILEVEGGTGMVRPITVNMAGLILERLATTDPGRDPRKLTGSELLRDYVRRSLARFEVQDHAPAILDAMITERKTKHPRTLAELSRKTGLPEPTIVQCLTILSADGLVRRLDDREHVWEVAHDFLARLLSQVLCSWRRPPWQRLRALFRPERRARWFDHYDEDTVNRRLPSGEFPLHLAARNLHDGAEAVDRLLDLGARIDARDRAGRTALHVAAESRNLAAAELLLARGADVHASVHVRGTPLHVAASFGHRDVAELLLDHGADIQAEVEFGGSPLHVAASRGHREFAELLLARGANPDAQDRSGETPLHEAASKGHRHLVELLLANRGDLNALPRDFSDRSALHHAAWGGSGEVAELLLTRGIDAVAKDRFGDTPLHRAADRGHREVAELLLRHAEGTVHSRDRAGRTPLHRAASSGHLDVAERLLAHGADLSARDDTDASPLHSAAWSGDSNVSGLLLAHGADADARDAGGATPLHAAASGGHDEVAALLLTRGADAEARDLEGRTALHRAASGGHVEVAERLLTRGADAVHAEDRSGQSPLHRAASSGHPELVELLLDHEAAVNARADHDVTPLHLAATVDDHEVAELLLAGGADVLAEDDRRWTPLHWAARSGRREVVERLLARGADPDASTIDGLTPLALAQSSGHHEVAELFTGRGDGSPRASTVTPVTRADGSEPGQSGAGDAPEGLAAGDARAGTEGESKGHGPEDRQNDG